MSCSTSDKITRSTSGIGASFEAECTSDVRWLAIKGGYGQQVARPWSRPLELTRSRGPSSCSKFSWICLKKIRCILFAKKKAKRCVVWPFCRRVYHWFYRVYLLSRQHSLCLLGLKSIFNIVSIQYIYVGKYKPLIKDDGHEIGWNRLEYLLLYGS